MQHYKAHHQIAQLKRHYDIKGEDLLGIYDTGIAGHYNPLELKYVTVSTSKVIWDRLAANPNIERAKHPGTGVECLKLFDSLYLRKQNYLSDEEVVWSSGLGCYVPRGRVLKEQFDAMLLSKSSTKKVIAYADELNRMLAQYIKNVRSKM